MTLLAAPFGSLRLVPELMLPLLVMLARAAMLGGVLFLLIVLRPLGWTLGEPGRAMRRGAGRVTLWAALIVTFDAARRLWPAASDLLAPGNRLHAALAAPVEVQGALAEAGAGMLIVLLLPLGVPGMVLLVLALVDIAAVVAPVPHALDGAVWLPALLALHWLGLGLSLGGLPAFTAALEQTEEDWGWRAMTGRFARVAVAGMVLLLVSGIGVGMQVPGDAGAWFGTRFGVLQVVKGALGLGLLALLCGMVLTMTSRRGGVRAPLLRLWGLTQIVLAVGLAAFAFTLAALPWPADHAEPHATWSDMAAPLRAAAQRIDALDSARAIAADWLQAMPHRAGLALLVVGALALLACAGLRLARHWPLLLVALGVAMLLLAGRAAWPLGARAAWASLTGPDMLRQSVLAVLLIALGLIEWHARRSGRVRHGGAALLLPLASGVAGVASLLLAGSGLPPVPRAVAMLLAAPAALMLIAAAAARWLEVRLDRHEGATAAWVWSVCMMLAGLLLLADPTV